MKICLLSGAVKNAGDYLITDRCSRILQSVYPDADLFVVNRNENLKSEQLIQMNNADCIIIGGGPCYQKDFYPNTMPLVSDINLIQPKLFMMGCGWFGATNKASEVWKYQFGQSTKALLKRVAADSTVFGCRDYYAVRVLKANGFDNSLMTGCPAWYDIDKLKLRLSKDIIIRSIAVSDPADVKRYGSQSMKICRFLKKRYPNAEMHYFFHRGVKADRYTNRETADIIEKLISGLTHMGFIIHDISYGSDGFSLYDSCDMHVGHRVHAHIYNLSQRKLSVLIEEDSRGAGVNEALGLWSIKAYNNRKKEGASSVFGKAYNKIFDYTAENPYVVRELDTYLGNMENSDYLIMDQAFAHMESYYQNMLLYTRSIAKVLEES